MFKKGKRGDQGAEDVRLLSPWEERKRGQKINQARTKE